MAPQRLCVVHKASQLRQQWKWQATLAIHSRLQRRSPHVSSIHLTGHVKVSQLSSACLGAQKERKTARQRDGSGRAWSRFSVRKRPSRLSLLPYLVSALALFIKEHTRENHRHASHNRDQVWHVASWSLLFAFCSLPQLNCTDLDARLSDSWLARLLLVGLLFSNLEQPKGKAFRRAEVHAYNLWRHLIFRRQRHVLTSGLKPVGNHYDLQSSYQIRSGVVARLFVGLGVLGACRSGFQQLAWRPELGICICISHGTQIRISRDARRRKKWKRQHLTSSIIHSRVRLLGCGRRRNKSDLSSSSSSSYTHFSCMKVILLLGTILLAQSYITHHLRSLGLLVSLLSFLQDLRLIICVVSL